MSRNAHIRVCPAQLTLSANVGTVLMSTVNYTPVHPSINASPTVMELLSRSCKLHLINLKLLPLPHVFKFSKLYGDASSVLVW